MEELKQIIEKNRMPVFVALSALLFIFVAFCPIVDVMGKASANGFEVLFDGKGMGFSRFLTFLMIVLPLGAAALNFIDRKGKEKWPLMCFGACFVIGILFSLVLPQYVSTAFGIYLYLLVSLAAAGAAYLDVNK